MSDAPDDLLAVATSVGDGAAVDWDALKADPELVEELRVIAQIARLHRSLVGSDTGPEETPREWRWGPLVMKAVLGRGAFGTVYRAWDPRLERGVALKVYRARDGSVDLDLSALFSEGRLLARVRHPNVVTVHGLEKRGSEVGLWTELIEGGTLADEVRVRGPLGFSEAALIGEDLCRALAAVHQAGLLHRDVKPQNVMRERGGRIVLMDFGIGLDLLDNQPTSRDAGGTPLYMAPELFDGSAATVSTDLYSLGVLLHFLVSGTHPVVASTRDALGLAHREGRRRLLRDVRADLPDAFVQVVDRACARDPSLRFTSAGEMEQALRRALGPASAEAESVVARTSWRSRALSALVALATLGAIAAGIRGFRGHSAPLTEKDTIVLADFVNTTGEPVFNDALKQGLSAKLLQSPFLNILPDQTLGETLKLMGATPGEPLPPPRAREVCLRTNSKAMVTGSISRLGTQYIVALRAQECRTGADLAREQVEAARKEDVLKALDKASARVRRSLGESRPQVDRYDVPLEQATTSSLDALHAYSLGLKGFVESGDAAAIMFYRRAVELDPQFAMAYVALGAHYGNLLEHALSRQSYEKAYALRDRASERERYRITAEYFIFVTGEVERANLVYQQWAREYPRDFKAFGRLARNRMLVGQLEEAVEPSLEALRLSPGAISQSFNLINLYLALNRVADAKAAYAQAIAQQPKHIRLHFLRYYIAFFENDAAEIQRQSDWANGHSGDEDQQLSMIADTAAYYGRFAEARNLRRQAETLAERSDRKEAVATYLITGALAEAETHNSSKARQMTSVALGLTSSPELQAMAALALARSGETRQAAELADTLNQRLPRDSLLQGFWLPTVRASIALEANAAQQAIDVLDVSSKYERAITYMLGGTLYPAYVRGEAYLRVGKTSEAVREFQRVIDNRGLVLNFVIGSISHLQVGRAKARAGDREGARRAYERFFQLWSNADAGVPILRSARSEFAQLR